MHKILIHTHTHTYTHVCVGKAQKYTKVLDCLWYHVLILGLEENIFKSI